MTRYAVLIVVAALVAPLPERPVTFSASRPPSDDLAIVVHRSNPVERLTLRELRRIFMFETQTWPHGRKITVVLREKEQPERAEAIRLVCGITEEQYDRHILQEVFQGDLAQGPREILSASAMLRFIFNAPGAVGYVPGDETDSTIKVLRIDGLLPGEAGYPLRRLPRKPGSPGG